MHVHFCAHGQDSFASHRFRVLKPVELLNARGVKATWSSKIDINADLNIFGKEHSANYDSMTHTLMKQFGKRTAYDLSDYHLQHPTRRDYYLKMISESDFTIVPSLRMKNALIERDNITKPIHVVPEPCTFPSYSPDLINCENPKLLWFGHFTNLHPVFPFAAALDGKYPLTVISNKEFPQLDIPGVTFEMWREGLVEEEIRNHDFVVMPLEDHPSKNFKSPNRGVDTLKAGRFFITNSPVYEELKPFCWIGDILEGIEWARKNPDKVKEMVRLGQNYVIEQYSDVRLGDAWELALTGRDRSKERDV